MQTKVKIMPAILM